MAKVVLEYQQEELRQLEKMYKADDITEETEEIVLRRARDNVEQAKFMLEFAQLNHDHALKFDLPRKEEQVNEAAKRTALDWEKNKAAPPLGPATPAAGNGKTAAGASSPKRSSNGCWPTAS